MTLLFISTILSILIKYFNYLRVANDTIRLKNKFTALNSQLHILVANGSVNPNDKRFLFLRTAFSHSEVFLQRMNFWVIVYFAYKNRKAEQPTYVEFENGFYNSDMKNILHEFTKESARYFNSKNKISMTIFRITMISIKLITSLFHRTRGITFFSNFKKRFKLFLLNYEMNNDMTPC
jgi:hypothetical protein